jgi:hypothetical protein
MIAFPFSALPERRVEEGEVATNRGEWRNLRPAWTLRPLPRIIATAWTTVRIDRNWHRLPTRIAGSSGEGKCSVGSYTRSS